MTVITNQPNDMTSYPYLDHWDNTLVPSACSCRCNHHVCYCRDSDRQNTLCAHQLQPSMDYRNEVECVKCGGRWPALTC